MTPILATMILALLLSQTGTFALVNVVHCGSDGQVNSVANEPTRIAGRYPSGEP